LEFKASIIYWLFRLKTGGKKMNYTKQDLEDSIKHCSEKLLELDKKCGCYRDHELLLEMLKELYELKFNK